MNSVTPWTWSPIEHPRVMRVFAEGCTNLDWCDQLETAASDATTGKVLCVCAALGIARRTVGDSKVDVHLATDALRLLEQWIDDPTGERFDHICSLIFDEDAPALDQSGIVWWSLRVATSSVDNFEAGWALGSACQHAVGAGQNPSDLRRIAQSAVLAREQRTVDAI